MLQLNNRTPFVGELFLAPDPDGIDSLYTLVKGTFRIGERLSVADCQEAVVLADEYRGEAGRSSLAKGTDLSLMKTGTDVLLQGTAFTPGSQPVTQIDILFAVGPVRKLVRVFGDRQWISRIGDRITDPQPFVSMPLVWERAFGGSGMAADGIQRWGDPRNPVGTGFVPPNGQSSSSGLRLPNLECPEHPIRSPKDRPDPAGFAPVCPDWEPRRRYAGTYDQHWQEHRVPYLPEDFDARFFQLAPLGMVAAGFLSGTETVTLINVCRQGPLQFALPGCRLMATVRLDDRRHHLPMVLDTVLVEPDELRLQMVWRTAFSCDKKGLRVREVDVALQH